MADSHSSSRVSSGAAEKESTSAWLSSDPKIDELVRLMKDPKTGVDIRDRSFLFSTYKSCFTGEDFTSWCTRRGICSSKPLAVQLGQSLYRKGIITGAASDGFKDGGAIFYLEGRPLLSGFLLTRPDPSAVWSAKWFVLRQEKLYMYTTAHDMKPELSVPLEDAYVRLLREDVGKEFGFEVVTTEKIYQLIALSYFEMDRWLTNLGAIVTRGLGVEDAWIETAEIELEKRETERSEEWLEKEEKRREEILREHRESPRTNALPPHHHPHSGAPLGSTPSAPPSAFIRNSTALTSSSGAEDAAMAHGAVLSRSPDDIPTDLNSSMRGMMRRSKPIEAQQMRKFP